MEAIIPVSVSINVVRVQAQLKSDITRQVSAEGSPSQGTGTIGGHGYRRLIHSSTRLDCSVRNCSNGFRAGWPNTPTSVCQLKLTPVLLGSPFINFHG